MKIFVLLAFAAQLYSGGLNVPLVDHPRLIDKQFVSSPEEAAIVVYQNTHQESNTASNLTSKITYVLKEIDTESVVVWNVPIPKLTFTDSTEKPKTAPDVIDDTVGFKPSYRLYRNGFLIFSTD